MEAESSWVERKKRGRELGVSLALLFVWNRRWLCRQNYIWFCREKERERERERERGERKCFFFLCWVFSVFGFWIIDIDIDMLICINRYNSGGFLRERDSIGGQRWVENVDGYIIYMVFRLFFVSIFKEKYWLIFSRQKKKKILESERE